MRRLWATAAVCVLACSSAAFADNWPNWRGPTGQGFCLEKKVPTTWSDKQNVKWKIKLENQGNSTPVVWGDKIFLTQANKGGSVRSTLCFDRKEGKLLWQKDVTYSQKERNWNENWYANASPVVEADRVVVSLGSAGMVCYDHNGKELWSRTDLGHWEHQFGNSSSPILHGDLAILWCGPNLKGRNFLLAVKKTTGETVWEHDEKEGSWGTPVIAEINQQQQMLLGTGPSLKGFDPKTGKELWKCDGLTSYVYSSPLVGNGYAVALSGYGGAGMGLKVGGSGDITGDRLWRHPKNTQRVGSGMLIDGHLYIVEENGLPHCYDVKTGEEKWKVKERPGAGTTWGSMVHADGRLYVLMRNGETQVYKARPEFELIGINSLGNGEQTNSSLAISDGEVFIRTFRHLWCIRE